MADLAPLLSATVDVIVYGLVRYLDGHTVECVIALTHDVWYNGIHRVSIGNPLAVFSHNFSPKKLFEFDLLYNIIIQISIENNSVSKNENYYR